MQDFAGRDGQGAFIGAVRDIAAMDVWEHWAEDPNQARSLLARLYLSLSGSGQLLRINRVDGYVESDLDAKVQRIGTGLDIPNGPFWPDFGTASVEEVFDAAFLAMRMLDEALSQQPAVMLQETLVEFETDAGFFVLPCRKISGGRDRMTGQGLSRRGLLYHRIAPVQHDGVRLALHVHPDVGLKPDRLPPVRKVGAAVFPRLQLQMKASEINGVGNFVVTGLTCDPPQDQVVANQCQNAAADHCDTLVWPELTMPPERVEQVRELLREAPLDGDCPPVVVAGSWHVEGCKGFRNRSKVLDGRGERMFWFDKCLAYMERKSPQGSAEDIEHGETVQLLLAEDELIVFQICLDFCHADREALLKACDASLVIVPSMGEGPTIRDHLLRAAALQTSNNTRTVVVQQSLILADPPDSASFGYILPGASKPLNFTESDTLTSQQFTSFYTECDDSQE